MRLFSKYEFLSMKFAHIITIILFVVSSSSKIFSQSQYAGAISPDSLVGNVYGTVHDSLTGEPISNAEIFLFNQSIKQYAEGNYILPDSDKAVKKGASESKGKFLINFVRTPAPYKLYTVIIKAKGYNQLIINDAPILPGAAMAFQIDAKLIEKSQQSEYFQGTDKNGPFMYRCEAVEKQAMRKTSNISNVQKTNDLNYQVYATREGLVGGTCANGHIIVSHDHFVALPSFRVLNKDDNTYDFQVQVTYGSKSVIAPVWDVGPWNVKDDYWNPDSLRAIYATLHHGGKPGLGEGVPESQAAYLYNYNQDWSGDFNNSGSDYYQVKNPSGIDLADGTFLDDLKLTDNSWVKVNYLWRPGVSVGDSVIAQDSIPMLDTPAGNIISYEKNGNQGTIIAGPGNGTFSGTYYIWWKILWKDSLIGWSYEKNLLRAGFNTVHVTITTDPAGLNFTADGSSYTSPHTFSWFSYASHSISASSQTSTDIKNTLKYWSDRGENPHNIYPYKDATYTAYFKTQYHVNFSINPIGSGQVSQVNGVWLNKDTVINIIAQANNGYSFEKWTGDFSGTSNPLLLVVTKPFNITANFVSTTDIKTSTSNLPKKYLLYQNYPNPFNPSTNIKFALPFESKVQLSVYNLLGKRVEVLLNETLSAGYHEINYKADNLSSGIYFYKILAISEDGSHQYNSVMKLILMK